MKRRRVRRGIVGGTIAVVVVAIGAYLWANPVDVGSPTTQFSVLTADFGLRRTPLTRSFDLYLCDPPYSEMNLAECPGPSTDTADGASGPSDAKARPVRPEIVSTTIGGELVQVDSKQPIVEDGPCNRMARASQFPSSQIKAVAENRGAADLVVSLTADSSTPEEVRPGTYCGYVTVARASGEDIPLFVLASVGDRGQGGLRVRIFLALLGGALMGAVVKWLGDRYAPVAGLRRRQRRLMRRFGAWRRFLPERAQYNLMVVEDGIGSFDPDGVDAALNDLELQGDALTKFGSAMAELDRLLPAQEEYCDAPAEPPVSQVLAAEYSLVASLRGEKFPWADPDDTSARADRLRNHAKALLVALKSGDMSGYAEAADDILGSVTDDQVQRLADLQQRRPEGYRVVTRAEPVVVIGPEARTFAQILLDNSLLITMVAGAFVVAFVGFQSQFVSDSSFDAGNGDYLRLFAWAFALQVAGVTVLEVAGKLVTSAATGGGRSGGG